MPSGKLIAMYGIPRSGKTSQADILVQTFKRKEYNTEYNKYPLYKQKPSGEFLNEFLNRGQHAGISERELQLWFTLNRLQYQPTLKEEIEDGAFNIVENYVGMSMAYGMLAGVKQEWLETINEPVRKADISILLTSERVLTQAPANQAKTLRELQGHYADLATKHAWYTINGDQKMMEVHMNIWDVVKKVI